MYRISFFIAIFSFAVISSTFAQRYRTAGGLRLGEPFGLTIQQHLWETNTIEGIVTYSPREKESEVSVLFETHRKLLGKRLNYYVGAGPYIGNRNNTGESKADRFNQTYIGTNFIGGIELAFKNTVISWDYKPGINLVGGNGLINHHTAISLRYIIIKPKKKEKKWKFWEKWRRKE